MIEDRIGEGSPRALADPEPSFVQVRALLGDTVTIASECADRSGGPAMKPKLGDSYEMGADGTWRIRGHARRGGQLTLEGPWTCRGVAAGDYKPRAALIDTHVFSTKTDTPLKIELFLYYYNSPNGYAHSNCIEILCNGVLSIPKVTVPMPTPIAMRHHT